MHVPFQSSIYDILEEKTRLRILNVLLKGEQCICNLIIILLLPPSTLSQHIEILENADLVSSRKSGAWLFYKTNLTNETKVETMRLLEKHNQEDEIYKEDLARLATSKLWMPEEV